MLAVGGPALGQLTMTEVQALGVGSRGKENSLSCGVVFVAVQSRERMEWSASGSTCCH